MQIFITLLLALFCILVNIPLGKWSAGYKKFSLQWFILIHASVPLIITLRLWLETDRIFIPLFIACAVAGQFIGRKIKKVRVNIDHAD